MSSTPAKKPVAVPAAATVGVLAALAVIAAGAVSVREALLAADLIAGTSWLQRVLDKAEVLKPADWMIPAGIAAVLIGLVILVAALKPRKTTHLAVGDTGVWIRGRDAARLANDTATTIDSITSAATKAKGRKLRVSARVTGDAARVREELPTAIAQRLQTITPQPRIRTRVTVEEH